MAGRSDFEPAAPSPGEVRAIAFEAPNWDMDQLAAARKALNDLAVLGFDSA